MIKEFKKVNHKKVIKWLKYFVAYNNTSDGVVSFNVNKGIKNELDFILKTLNNKVSNNVNYELETANNKITFKVFKGENLAYILYKKSYALYLLEEDEAKLVSPNELESLYDLKNQEQDVILKGDSPYKDQILEFCQVARKRSEIQELIGIHSRPYFMNNILGPLVKKKLLVPTNPNMRASNQKYITNNEANL